MSWSERAACRGDKRNWFPNERTSPNLIVDLLETCAACPVSRECLSTAMTEESRMKDVWGIRGGLLASERKRLRRMLALKAAA